VRQRYGIHADVAGKTGTTQGNADGWFILMHPEIVTGAWAGFNDPRITLRSDRWGQGSRSALPMVGDFMSRALRSPVIDAKARFAPPEQSHWWSDMVGRLRERMQDWWPDQPPPAQPGQPTTPEPAPAPEPAPEPTDPPGPGLSPGEEIIESTPALPAPSIPLTQGTLGPTDQRAVQEATPATPALPSGEEAPAGTGVVITPIQP
jgi:penicillin-binding protein 1A